MRIISIVVWCEVHVSWWWWSLEKPPQITKAQTADDHQEAAPTLLMCKHEGEKNPFFYVWFEILINNQFFQQAWARASEWVLTNKNMRNVLNLQLLVWSSDSCNPSPSPAEVLRASECWWRDGVLSGEPKPCQLPHQSKAHRQLQRSKVMQSELCAEWIHGRCAVSRLPRTKLRVKLGSSPQFKVFCLHCELTVTWKEDRYKSLPLNPFIINVSKYTVRLCVLITGYCQLMSACLSDTAQWLSLWASCRFLKNTFLNIPPNFFMTQSQKTNQRYLVKLIFRTN